MMMVMMARRGGACLRLSVRWMRALIALMNRRRVDESWRERKDDGADDDGDDDQDEDDDDNDDDDDDNNHDAAASAPPSHVRPHTSPARDCLSAPQKDTAWGTWS